MVLICCYCRLRAWGKNIVTTLFYITSYNSFAPTSCNMEMNLCMYLKWCQKSVFILIPENFPGILSQFFPTKHQSSPQENEYSYIKNKLIFYLLWFNLFTPNSNELLHHLSLQFACASISGNASIVLQKARNCFNKVKRRNFVLMFDGISSAFFSRHNSGWPGRGRCQGNPRSHQGALLPLPSTQGCQPAQMARGMDKERLHLT